MIDEFLDLLFCLVPTLIVGVPNTGASLTPELELPKINFAPFNKVKKIRT